MANRKLTKDAQPLDEMVAQTFDRRTQLGKDVMEWYAASKRHNLTTDTALLRRFAQMIQLKGVRGYDGERVQVRLGAMVKGARLAHAIPGRLVHERIGTSHYSGKSVVRAYPVSITLYDRDGNAYVKAGYTNDSRLSSENIIGPDQADLAITMLNRLGAPEFRKLLEERITHTDAERESKAREVLDSPLDRMPEVYRQMIKDHGVNVDILRQEDLLSIGEHLLQEHWSAVLFALDPAKNKNLTNWFNERADKNLLPDNVRDDWAYIRQFPHRDDIDEKLKRVGAYQLQWKPEGRKAVAGYIAEELRWLAGGSRDAKAARKAYGKDVNLKQAHEPATFFIDSQPPHAETVEKLLEEPYWTVADREGLLRKFPLVEFRQEYNKNVLYKRFKDDDGFKTAIQALERALENKRVPEGELPFAYKMLKRMRLGIEEKYSVETLTRRTSLHNAIKDYDKLCVLTKLAQRENGG